MRRRLAVVRSLLALNLTPENRVFRLDLLERFMAGSCWRACKDADGETLRRSLLLSCRFQRERMEFLGHAHGQRRADTPPRTLPPARSPLETRTRPARFWQPTIQPPGL